MTLVALLARSCPVRRTHRFGEIALLAEQSDGSLGVVVGPIALLSNR
jgi:hypothetical protein